MDAHSLNAASELFALFPEWRALARTEKGEDGTEFLLVDVTPPLEANVEYGLTIDTAGGEVTVGFDYYHSHFDAWVGDGEHFGTKAALEFIRQIVSEEVAVASWWKGEEWRGSTQVPAGEKPKMTWMADFDRIRVRSWRGSLNADVAV
jgi:hypothetical protein